MFRFDVTHISLPHRTRDEAGNVLPLTLTCEFFRISEGQWMHPADPHEDAQPFDPPAEAGPPPDEESHWAVPPVATLSIDFDADGQVLGVHLSKYRLTGTEVARFPWPRWISAATHARLAHLRLMAGGRGGPDETALFSEVQALTNEARRKRRPGRGGHPREFYEALAARYSALVAAEVPNPVQTLVNEAAERGEHISRNTVATWIKRARALGLLPPGRSRKTDTTNTTREDT